MTATNPSNAPGEAPLRRSNGRPLVRAGVVRGARAIAEAVFSRAGQPPPVERLDWVEREVEDHLARSGARSRFLLSLMVSLVCVLGPLSIFRFSALSELALPVRVRALSELERRFAGPLLAVKALLCLVYYEHPDAQRDVGFDGECALPRTAGGAVAGAGRRPV